VETALAILSLGLRKDVCSFSDQNSYDSSDIFRLPLDSRTYYSNMLHRVINDIPTLKKLCQWETGGVIDS